MARYEGNRIKALAAYNAGPSRVARWSDGAMSVDQWVDAIPFSETREYVQAVLAYDVIADSIWEVGYDTSRRRSRRAVVVWQGSGCHYTLSSLLEHSE